MATSLSTSLRNTLMNALTTAAGSTAYLWFWSGSAPAKVSNLFVEPTGSLGALFALPNPVAPAAVVGEDTFSAITNVNALANITPGYYRLTAGTAFVLSAAALSGSNTTYTGTITGGGSNAFVGAVVNVSGFVTTTGNNGTFTITASSGTSFTVVNASGGNESHAAAAVMDNITNVQWQGSSGITGTPDILWSSMLSQGGSAGITSLTYTDGNA